MANPIEPQKQTAFPAQVGSYEGQLAKYSGLRVQQFTYPLWSDPTYWVSDIAGGNGTVIVDAADWTDFTFPNSDDGDDQGQRGGLRLPYAVTPCVRYTSDVNVASLPQIQLRFRGFDQFGRFIEEISPVIEFENRNAGAVNTMYFWMSKCFQEVTQISYKLANKDAGDTIAIGVVHLLNADVLTNGLLGTNPYIKGSAAGADLDETVFGTALNYGLGAPLYLRGNWTPPPEADDTDFTTLQAWIREQGTPGTLSRAGAGDGEAQLVAAHLQTIKTSAVPDLAAGGVAAGGDINVPQATPASPTIAQLYEHLKDYIINPAWFLHSASGVTSPIRGVSGGMTLGARDQFIDGWEGDPFKIGFISLGVTLPFKQLDVFDGSTLLTEYVPPNCQDIHNLTVTYRTQLTAFGR